ncbi:MAG: hypothetical protein M1308_13610 [Actinobacteria bacterium]|nr:hypothetical protein [Actinomycetota bacterium]
MAKSDLTISLERDIWAATVKAGGIFGCFEVTIGFWGDERVDYMTYDTKGIWRCYEIKVSKSDFQSKAKKTFVGHYNYFVMPMDLYNQVKAEIPAHIGIYAGENCIKKAKKQQLIIDEQILKDSMIRSLYREAEKLIKSKNPAIIEGLNRRLKYADNEAKEYKRKYWDLMRIGQQKYGNRWYEED